MVSWFPGITLASPSLSRSRSVCWTPSFHSLRYIYTPEGKMTNSSIHKWCFRKILYRILPLGGKTFFLIFTLRLSFLKWSAIQKRKRKKPHKTGWKLSTTAEHCKIYPVNITVRINALEIEHLKCCFVTDSGWLCYSCDVAPSLHVSGARGKKNPWNYQAATVVSI